MGLCIGGALVAFFSAILTHNTIEAAYDMAEAGEEQLKRPGVLDGTVKPDYKGIIELAANNALRHMLLPSILALVSPILFGFSFGPFFVLGLLVGSTAIAICLAIYNGNSGGAFDGDTRKDVVGVALDIFIKTMSTVANTLAPLFVAFHLF